VYLFVFAACTLMLYRASFVEVRAFNVLLYSLTPLHSQMQLAPLRQLTERDMCIGVTSSRADLKTLGT